MKNKDLTFQLTLSFASVNTLHALNHQDEIGEQTVLYMRYHQVPWPAGFLEEHRDCWVLCKFTKKYKELFIYVKPVRKQRWNST